MEASGDEIQLGQASFESWDEYFMSLTFFVAMKSKDRSTKVGAVIVNSLNGIVSTGYNGFPRKVDDDVKERHERPLKYLYVEHAERNSLYNAAISGARAQGGKLYTQWIPCADCARGIIQNGIIEVVHFYPLESEMMRFITLRNDWKESAEEGLKMFSESGVKVRRYVGPLKTSIYQVCGERISVP